MESTSPPIDLPEDLRRGLEVHAAQAGKSPSDIVIAALDHYGVERLTEDQMEKRMTGSQ